VDRELELADLRAELSAFEGLYLRRVGVLYAELDELNARIAELIAEEEGTQEARAGFNTGPRSSGRVEGSRC